jgi:hypothetical protein
MKKTVLKFGLICGAILSAMFAVMMPFAEKIGFDNGMIVGYTIMVLAFLLVFFGIRSYRDTIGHGRISFGRALGVGLLIVAIAGVCYVVTWEIVYYKFLPDFSEKYAAHAIEKVRNSGKSPEEIAQEVEQMKQMMTLYKNNILFNMAVTFLEPLPVGLIMTLISALILRKREPKESLETGLPDLQN